ncbi:MAG: hypothetical protein ABRQ24_11680, partial [Syntrophomonadaceae bacterium]
PKWLHAVLLQIEQEKMIAEAHIILKNPEGFIRAETAPLPDNHKQVVERIMINISQYEGLHHPVFGRLPQQLVIFINT